MEQNAYIMEVLAGIVCLVLGVRLYRRSRQSSQRPEQFLGMTLLIWAVGYALYDIPYAFVDLDDLIPPFFSYASMIAFSLGSIALAIFAKEVFRKRENWAGWVVVAIAVCTLLGATGSAWVGDWEQVDPFDNLGYWPQTLANFVPTFWLGVEGFALLFSVRRRAALDFEQPLIRHRILLLGLTGALWALLEVVIFIQDFVYINAGDWSAALGIANGLFEIAPFATLWLAFCPPVAYRRWVEGAAPA
jgi:hypothetical protein